MSDARLKILSLPDLQLSDDEWLEISEIINSLEHKTIEAFKICFNEKKSEAVINPKNLTPLFIFITAWFDTTQHLLKWIKHLHEVWIAVTNKNNMSADNLMPLLIELLPKDILQLNELQKKLELALRIKNLGETGYYLTNLLIAVSAKIIRLEENDSPIEKTILLVANEVKQLEQIALLIPACNNYKDYLRDNFIVLLQTSEQDKENYQYCLELCSIKTNGINKDEIMNIVIENIGKPNLILKHPDLMPLLEKYFVLYEMQATLIRTSKSAADKLLEFSAKFIQHHDILTKNLDSSARTFMKMANANLGINRVYEYIGWEDVETKFLKMAGLFSKQAQNDSPAVQNTTESSMHLHH